MTKLAIENFSFRYRDSGPDELSQITWTPAAGSFNLLIGASGSGKSTLLKAMTGLLPQFGGTVTSGEITLDDLPIATVAPFERAKRVALLFQNPNRQFAMATPLEQITFALENIQAPAADIPHQVDEALATIGITALANQNLITLSGGEKQKVALATILALGSDYILLDEPFANVDPHARHELMHLLKQLQMHHGKTIIVADHDFSGYPDLIDTVYQLVDHQLTQTDASVLSANTGVDPLFPAPSRNALSPLALDDVSIDMAGRPLIESATFALPAGQLGLLSGVNGSGKSTLFAAITHQRPYRGLLHWDGQDSQKIKMKRWAQTVGLVFQDAMDQFVALTVADELALSQKHTRLPDYWTTARIEQTLDQLNLTPHTEANVYQLSGGQQKKLQVLSMLIMSQPVLLLDEPLAGLDTVSMQHVLDLIQTSIQANHISALMISHQRIGLADYVDYEIHLQGHHLIMGGAQ
ncbi:ABC transporter ATP-binding protein [Weissella viridescens]|uniref:ABC transporter ATP-binding protein n=1 Tax=Weissella viridescens TaxID=1629 RepID=A0A3P2RBG9_WEIVI|nr:ABC transporter ATP-binding protein [Weissella viridescens]RRG17884.1 ABC transporter ATP-binding protein [Weissella viridescens]